tara:strand:- start:111 stop:374 length:264 start_codon:yes stop_codon:yes gene_type:complete
LSLTKIKYIIKPDGNFEEEEVHGVVGHNCQSITMSIENQVGEVVSRDYLASFFVTGSNPTDENIQNLEDKTGVDSLLPGSLLSIFLY